MIRYRLSLLAGVLSIVCYVVGMSTMPPGAQDSVLSDVLLWSCIGLCITAGFLGTKRWWWLLLLYAGLSVLYFITHFTLSF